MSVFASYHVETIPVPNDAPHTVTIQKLSGKDIEKAQAEHLSNLVMGRSARGWASDFQSKVARGTATEADAQKMLRDPLNGYDRFTVVRRGLKGWSFTQPKEGGGEEPKPITDTTVGDLDDETLEHFAREIMRLTKPSLFETEQTAGSDRKNV